MTAAQKQKSAENRKQAIDLMAKGKLTAEEIATKLDVSRRTICAWKALPDFQEAVRAAKNAWRTKARSEGLGDPDYRLRLANDEHKRLRAIILQRAASPEMQGIPGGDTGLLTVTYKMQSMGEGLGSEAKAEYTVDTPLLERTQALRDEVATAKGEIKLKIKPADGTTTINVNVLMQYINAGRERVIKEKAEREATDAAARPADRIPEA